jgi:hypothetical protein
MELLTRMYVCEGECTAQAPDEGVNDDRVRANSRCGRGGRVRDLRGDGPGHQHVGQRHRQRPHERELNAGAVGLQLNEPRSF